MEQECPSCLQQIPPEDWKKTPASVKKLVEEMGQRIETLEKQQAELLLVQQQLLEKVNSTSKNSSSPPKERPSRIWKEIAKK